LLVDDDEAILVAVRSLFAQWGIDLIAAPGLEEAAQALAAGGRQPSLILSDYRLPGDYDGIGVVTRLRAICGEAIHSVLITGDTGQDAMLAISQSGLRVLRKPLQPAKLRALLMHYLS
jgi:CheY-like chemotaxis protein